MDELGLRKTAEGTEVGPAARPEFSKRRICDTLLKFPTALSTSGARVSLRILKFPEPPAQNLVLLQIASEVYLKSRNFQGQIGDHPSGLRVLDLGENSFDLFGQLRRAKD